MHQSVAENVYLNLCKKCFATTENSVEKAEKPFLQWADFIKVEKFDLIKKSFQGSTALKCKPIFMFYASICSWECLFESL